MLKKHTPTLKISLLSLVFLLILGLLTLSIFMNNFPYTFFATQEYDTGTYGSGAYGEGVSSGGSSSGIVTLDKVNSWSKILPDLEFVMKDFDSDFGIKQISIYVNNESQDVKITVTKHIGKPANYSVENFGKIYKYLEIKTENINDNLEKAIIKIQVEKSWVEENDIDFENMALFKLEDKWNELKTTYTEEDDNYYYYEIELNSFSEFVISGEGEGAGGEEQEIVEEKSNFWLWLVFGIAIMIGIVVIIIILKKEKEEDKEISEDYFNYN